MKGRKGSFGLAGWLWQPEKTAHRAAIEATSVTVLVRRLCFCHRLSDGVANRETVMAKLLSWAALAVAAPQMFERRHRCLRRRQNNIVDRKRMKLKMSVRKVVAAPPRLNIPGAKSDAVFRSKCKNSTRTVSDVSPEARLVAIDKPAGGAID
jgi:hypothetical protein